MRSIKKGATSQSVYVEILDSTSTTGGRKTGLAYNTASLTAYYVRNQESPAAITLATLAAANSAWSSGGFVEVDATNMPGLYRLDLPNAALASGVDDVSITLRGATGMAQVSLAIQLVDNVALDIYSRLGAPAGASIAADLAQIYGVVDTEVAAIKAKTDNLPTDPADASDIAATLATIAGYIDTEVAAIFNRIGAPVGVSISADIAAVKTQTAAIETDTQDIQARIPAALVAGRIDASIGAAAANTLTASALATDAVTEIQSGLATASALTTVAGYIDTEVAAIKAKTDNLPADPADASDVAAAFGTVNGTLATIAGYLDTEIAAIKAVTDKVDDTLEDDAGTFRFTTNALEQAPSGGGGLTVQDIVDGVWNEAITGHLTAGSTGNALNAAGSAGDPWTTPLPGAYGAGTAGKIIGDNVDAAISSRASQTSVDTLAGYVDTEVAAIFNRIGAPVGASISADVAAVKAQTVAIEADTQDIQARIPAALVAGRIDASIGAAAVNTLTASALAADAVAEIQSGLATAAALTTVAGYIDTEVAAIKAKTDNLPADPADASDIAAAFGTVNGTLATVSGYLDTEVAAIKAKTDNLPAAPAAVGDIPTATDNADALLDRAAGVETGWTLRQAMRIMLSVLAGKASGLATTTAVYRDMADTKNRISAEVDADGNRSAVTRDAS